MPVLSAAIAVQKKEVVLHHSWKEIESLEAVAARLQLAMTAAEVVAWANLLNAHVAALAEAVHCWRVCLYDWCPGLTVSAAAAAAAGDGPWYLVMDTIDMVVGSFETEVEEKPVTCNSLLEMPFLTPVNQLCCNGITRVDSVFLHLSNPGYTNQAMDDVHRDVI